MNIVSNKKSQRKMTVVVRAERPILEVLVESINGNTANVNPRKVLPTSPMNTFAGCQLNTRNPAHAPIRMALRVE